MFQSGYDNLVFDKFVKLGHGESDVKRLRNLYESTRAKDQRWNMLEEQAKRLRGSRSLPLYFRRGTIEIVIEELVYSVKSHPNIRDRIFGHTETERDLYPIIQGYLKQLKNQGDYNRIIPTFDRKELPVGNPDFVGIKRNWHGGETLTAIDAKSRLSALHDFYRQASKYQKAFDRVYLATTRWVAIQEGEFFWELVKKLGVGLVGVDVSSKRCDTILSPERTSAEDKNLKRTVIDML
jgi:hypothetical protein